MKFPKFDIIDVLIIVFIVLLTLLAAFMGLYVSDEVDLNDSRNDYNISNITSYVMTVNTTRLEDDVSNNVSLVRLGHIYNVTDDKLVLNDTEIFVSGGDCKDWSEYYVRQFNNSYYAQVVYMQIKPKVRHAVAIVSDKTGYCIIDQINYKCYRILEVD